MHRRAAPPPCVGCNCPTCIDGRLKHPQEPRVRHIPNGRPKTVKVEPYRDRTQWIEGFAIGITLGTFLTLFMVGT